MATNNTSTCLTTKKTIFSRDVATPLVKGIFISFERAANPLVKSLGYFTQGCGCLSFEGYFDSI
jgi:hypothetical protein